MAQRSRPRKRPAQHPPEVQAFINWQSRQYIRPAQHGGILLPLALLGGIGPRTQLTVAAFVVVGLAVAMLVGLVAVLSPGPLITMSFALVLGACAASLVVAMIAGTDLHAPTDDD